MNKLAPQKKGFETGFIRKRSGMRIFASCWVCIIFVLFSADLSALDLPTTKPEKVGMSSDRLERINSVIQRHIDDGTITCAVTAVARRGKIVHFQAHGFADVDKGIPLSKDAIFSMMSSSKPVTGVAVLMLMEEGKIRLTDPVHRFIPEFKDMKVAVPKGNGPRPSVPRSPRDPKPEVDLISARRDITVQDLLTHTSGLLSGGLGSFVSNIRREPGDTLADVAARLGAVPLDFQPGTRWQYSGSTGFDVLGRIVEVASGQSFDEFLRERIFEPLGMKDTFFNLPEDRKKRFVPLYRKNDEGNWEKRPAERLLAKRTYFAGASGLFSTAHDYLMFEQMLVNKGELNGKRLLGPRTVELMASNFVGDLFSERDEQSQGLGFGLTVSVMLDSVKAGRARSNGSFGWGGAFGTMSWTDPKEEIAAVIMLHQPIRQVQRDFEFAIRQAIMD